MKEKVFKDLPIDVIETLDDGILYVCEKCKGDGETDDQIIFEFAETDLDDPNRPICPNCGGELAEKEAEGLGEDWGDSEKMDDEDDSPEIELDSEEEEE